MLEEELEKLKLPELLKYNNNTICNIDEWKKRREEIKDILCREEYGDLVKYKHVPITYEILKEDDKYCGAKFIYRHVLIKMHLDNGEYSFPLRISIPKTNKKCPAFLALSFYPEFPNKFLPVEEICDNGFAVVSVCYTEISSDDSDFENGLSKFFFKNEQSRNFGKISLWAYAAMHVMDYMQTIQEIDKENVAIVGHSRLGKTALLTSAFDERFKYTISNDAGQSGDSLSRGKTGEHVREICDRFPYWFVPKYKNYVDNEESMPFDQHFLLSLIAPRYLYIEGASDNSWADPHAQVLACIATSPVYNLYNLDGFIYNNKFPDIGEQLGNGYIGYHIRKGWHFLSRFDWNMFMKYIKEKNEVH